MATDPTDETEGMAALVRRIAMRELEIIELEAAPISGLSIERLVRLSLVLQRVRTSSKADPEAGNGAEGLTNDQLMRRANG